MIPPRVPSVSAEEVDALRAEGAVLIDIRERKEWDEARIAGAELRPMSQIDDWWRDLPGDRTVILYCRSGSRSAHTVDALMRQAGMSNVVNLTGGIIAWEESGLDVER